MKTQRFESYIVKMFYILEFLICNLFGRANVPSYFITQIENMLEIAGSLIKMSTKVMETILIYDVRRD